jgi:hypothetical protein
MAYTEPGAQPAPQEDAATESATPDLSQGYCVELSVLPDGTFKVSGPEPLEAEAAEETGEAGSEMGEDVKTIGEALRKILEITKANPIAGDDQAQFEAGFNQQGAQ